VLSSFAVGYLVRGLDPEYAAWAESTRTSDEPAPGARLRFDATAYCKGTTTASGVEVQTGIAAADPTLLPVGSVVNVATGDVQHNGVYTIMDTGPRVQGRLLDLYMWSCYKALAFGRKGVDVTVLRLGWSPQASAPTLIDRLFRGREARRRIPPPDPPPPAGLPPASGAASEGQKGPGDIERVPSIDDAASPASAPREQPASDAPPGPAAPVSAVGRPEPTATP
jgi:3D (Asp-Asp-Asp) domain-containing protein